MDRELLTYSALVLAMILAVLLIGYSTTGCSSGQQARIEWDRAVTFSGDLRCEGSGSVAILGGEVASIDGTVNALGSGEGYSEAGGDACAGLVVRVGPYVWRYYAAAQSTASCMDKAQTLEVELAE